MSRSKTSNPIDLFDLSNRTAVVTGGAGFVGSNLIHFNYALEVLKINKLHFFCGKYYIAAKRENSGEFDTKYNIKRTGVNVSEVFIKNYLDKLKKFESRDLLKVIKHKLLFNHII